jgi:hypothetical protein
MFLTSIATAIKAAFTRIEPEIADEAVKLLELIFSGPDPRANLEKAKRALITDAANAAADAALDLLLNASSPPAGSELPPSSTPLKT